MDRAVPGGGSSRRRRISLRRSRFAAAKRLVGGWRWGHLGCPGRWGLLPRLDVRGRLRAAPCARLRCAARRRGLPRSVPGCTFAPLLNCHPARSRRIHVGRPRPRRWPASTPRSQPAALALRGREAFGGRWRSGHLGCPGRWGLLSRLDVRGRLRAAPCARLRCAARRRGLRRSVPGCTADSLLDRSEPGALSTARLRRRQTLAASAARRYPLTETASPTAPGGEMVLWGTEIRYGLVPTRTGAGSRVCGQ